MSKTKNQLNKGAIIAYILVFGSIALMMLAGLLGYIIIQLRMGEQKNAWNEALNIAEAGTDYYLWCLNGNVEADCAGVTDYKDKNGVAIGQFSINVSNSNMCGQTIRRVVVSTGWTNKYPSTRRSIQAVYARESVAAYSGVINANVWFGPDESLAGPFLSNGGVRMDGPNGSLVSSAALRLGLPKYVCGSMHCNPCPVAPTGPCVKPGTECICPSVFTTIPSNANTGLFQFPISPFNFSSITTDLGDIKTKAINNGGIYLAKSTTVAGFAANGKGYHLKFKNDGTVDVYIITALSGSDNFVISSETFIINELIPTVCSAIFVEDNVWPEGVVKGKVTLASANLIDANVDTSIILPSNITYAAGSGNGLLAIAENSVFIGPQSPDVLELNGVYVAQKGSFIRNNYSENIRTSFILHGSYVSFGMPNETYVTGATVTSGYKYTAVYYDANLVYDPPAFMPHLNPDYKIVNWQEIN